MVMTTDDTHDVAAQIGSSASDHEICAASQTAWATSGRRKSPWAPEAPPPSRMTWLHSRL